MFNKVIIGGNLTRDIEIRYTAGGSAVASTGIATTKRYKSQTGEQKEDTTFVDITFFGRTAEIANQYLKKGSKVLVEGRLKFDQWTAQDGTKRSKHSVVVENLQMLDSRPREEYQQSASPAPAHTQPTEQKSLQQPPKEQKPTATPPIPEVDINEDEIPF